jgi:C-terminal peptidase prc
MLRRVVLSLCLVLTLSVAALPVYATPEASSHQPHTITGTYSTSNPIYPTIGADSGVILYDFSGEITEDYAFVSPKEAQVLGDMNGDITSGSYAIDLPDHPQGSPLDFDGNPMTLPSVQVFVTATYINFIGDIFINRGETPMNISARIEPMTFDIIGGQVVVWSDHDGEQFPGGFGPDGAVFTEDDPLMDLAAGWSVVSMETEPFTIVRDEVVEVPIVENIGALYDYTTLSYEDAWESLFARTKETYPFAAEKHLDWDAIYSSVTPLVQAAKSDIDFHLAIAQFGALIPDTHIGYASVPVLQTLLVGGVGIRRLAVTDEGEIVVIEVLPNGPAGQAGIQAGDMLVKVDGDPALQVLEETPMLISSASTSHGRRFLQAATMLLGPVDSSVQLAWRTVDGTQKSATLTRVFDVSSLLAAFEPLDPDAPVVDSRMLESGVGYISVRGFAEEVSQADALFGEALDALVAAGAKGIILDLRSNSGGLVNLAMSIAGRFFPDYERVMDFYYANGEGGFTYRGFAETLTGTSYYDGPVAVLVNEMTGSAGDIFAYTLTLKDRALVVGNTPSGGFTGEVSDGQYKLPGDLTMQIPTGRPVDPASGETLIEGTGVVPDIVVPLTFESLISPEDEVLQAAEDAILGPSS